MSIKQQLDHDLKQAMLCGDKVLATTLRGLKSVILYAEVADGKRDTGIDDAKIVDLFTKELKKRQESADLYIQGGRDEKATAELAEKAVIQRYLPAQMTDEELADLVDIVIAELPELNQQAMGRIIGMVKARAGNTADGTRIAAMVKQKIAS